MKQLNLGIFAFFCAVSVLAQGTIVFNNRVVGDVVAPIYDVDYSKPFLFQQGNSLIGYPPGNIVYGGVLLEGSGYSAGLWAAPGPNQPETALQLVFGSVVPFRTGLGAGFFQAPTAALEIPGTSNGGQATLQVRVWDNRGGLMRDWDTADIKAKSALWNSLPLGGGPVPPPNLTGMTSFNLAFIPEPSAFALFWLGAAALLMLRCRNSVRQKGAVK